MRPSVSLSGLFILAVALTGATGGAAPRGEQFVLRRTAPGEPGPMPALSASQPAAEGESLLDEAGLLARRVTSAEVRRWQEELHRGTAAERSAWLHLRLGEYRLAAEREPERALWHFHQVRAATPRRHPLHGEAAYNAAVARFYRGAYRKAAQTFTGLLHAGELRGFDRRRAALWQRHASACWGYHQERERLGITEPAELDPLCGAAGLAVCLRALGKPFDRATVLRACPVDGIGSSLSDLLTACRRLGLKGRAVTADDQGLRLLPKPAIAFVEHDHFICVAAADRHGVTYFCSDCGHWPGGTRTVTWKQWHAMEPTFYVTVSRPGSRDDRLLAAVDAPRSAAKGRAPGVRVAAQGPVRLGLAPLAALLHLHVLRFLPTDDPDCGYKRESLHCPPGVCCPMRGAGPRGAGGIVAGDGVGEDDPGGDYGAAAGDPVNVATGEEEYEPGPDLVVYNPRGPDVNWSRIYNSMRAPGSAYQSDDFGVSWSHPYNVGVHDPTVRLNPQVPQASCVTFSPSGAEPPPAGLEWDVRLGGVTVATSAAPDGWTVGIMGITELHVGAPAGATATLGYTVRHTDGTARSGVFDVLPAGAALQGGTTYHPPTGTNLPSGSLTWEVRLGAAVIATSAVPNGWAAVDSSAFFGAIAVTAPLTATAGAGYEVRYVVLGSATFSVEPHRFTPGTGTRFLVHANGSRITLAAASVPTVGAPTVVCTVPPGHALRAEWVYDGTREGHYVLTFAGGTRWITTAGAKAIGTTGLYHLLSQELDRVGNPLNFYYGAPGAGGFPLLASIGNSAGATLLSFSRAGDGTGNLTGVSDAYGRSVYYHAGTYATTGVPLPYPQAYQELDQVSLVVVTGTVNPPLRCQYGYVNVNIGHAEQSVPYLSTLTVPSPTGTGTATATIEYAPATTVVSRIVDANGNSVVFAAEDQTHTRVTLKNAAGTVVYSQVVGFDQNMSQTTATDGDGTVLQSETYADPNTPYRPSTVTDANGRVSSFTWDTFGSVLTATTPRGTQTGYTRQYAPFPLGRLAAVQEGLKVPTTFTYFEPSGLLQSATLPRPGGGGTVTVSRTYDSLGNVLTVTGPGNNAAASVTTTYNYTSDGAYSQPAALGQPLTVTNPLGKVTHCRYDARGNLLSLTDALGNETNRAYTLADDLASETYPATGQGGAFRAATSLAYLYSGGPVTAVNSYGEAGTLVRQTLFSYGPEGETLSRTGSAEPVALAYDAAYRLTGLQDGNGRVTAYAYHTSGYLQRVTYPGGQTDEYSSYNAIGQLLARADGRGVVTNYGYADPENRLTSIQYPAYPAENAALTYDAYGRLSTLTDGAGTESFLYDDHDTPVSVTTTYAGLPARTVSYAFYPDGSRQSMTTHAQGAPDVFSYLYDAHGRATSLTNPFGESFSWGYLDNDWLQTQTSAGAATATHTFNARGFLTRLENRTPGGTLLSDFSGLVYDGVGNRTSQSASVPAWGPAGGLTTFGYDTRDQLLQEQSARNGGYTGSFGYDGAGNPTTFKGQARAYNLNNQDTAHTYDGTGNPTVYYGTALTYDPESRLSAVGATMTAGYRADGLRAWKQTVAGRTYFLYDGDTLLAELDAAGSVTATVTTGPNGLLARRSGGSTVLYTYDPHGSAAQRLDGAGTVLTSHLWDAYGSGAASGAWSDPAGYGAQWGYYRDAETGLYLLTHRYYDPGTGRFLTRDPISYAGGINLYGYCGNEPVGLVDASGKFAEEKGPNGTRYRIDWKESPRPDMHIYHPGGETNITDRGGWRRGEHRGKRLVPLPASLRKAYRPIIRCFVKRAGKMLPAIGPLIIGIELYEIWRNPRSKWYDYFKAAL